MSLISSEDTAMSDLTSHLKEISEQLANKSAILFLGSGSTLFCRRPDGKRGLTAYGLAQEILKETNNGVDLDPPFDASLMEACEYYTSVKAGSRKGLDTFIQTRLRDLQPTMGHYIACSFPWRAVVTTNFNEVAENAWKTGTNEGFAANEIVTITIDSDLGKYSGDHTRVRLYKPHGCVSVQQQQDNRMVLTSRDYSVSERIRKNIYDEIRYLIRNCTTVFAGYSLNDYTFRNIFYKLYDEMGEWTSQCYSVAPISPALKFEWMSKSMQANFKTTLINLPFDVFMLQLVKHNNKVHPNLRKKITEMWGEMEEDNASWLNGLSQPDFENLAWS